MVPSKVENTLKDIKKRIIPTISNDNTTETFAID